MSMGKRKVKQNKCGTVCHSIPKKEYAICILSVLLMIFLMARIFYGTFLAGGLLLPLAIPMIKEGRRKLLIKRQLQIEKQFKDMLITLSDAVHTGYSIENAITECYRDLIPIYGKDSTICKELHYMISQLKLRVNTLDVIREFAKRMDLASAVFFAEVLSVAQKTGGKMTEMINDVAQTMRQKELVQKEIEVLISAKQWEQKIMTFVPMVLVVYVSMASPGFLDVMYQTWLGRIIMTICMGGYIIAYFWSGRIVEIEF